MSGSFKTPQRLISYGAQASSYWSGAIGVTVDNSAGGRPYYRTYTISVPTGYYIRGFAYPTGITNSNNPYNVTVGNNIYEKMYASSSSLRPTILQPGEKVAISTLEAGNHIQKIQWNNTRMGGTIPKFDLITYPVNSATATGDIAFNDNFTRCFIPKKTWDSTSDLSIYLPKGEYLIKNFKFYYIENGQKVYYQNEDCEEVTDLSKWSLSAGLSAATVTPTEKKTDDEYVKIYKKGERVLYNIFL
jgi:hypothetical protein